MIFTIFVGSNSNSRMKKILSATIYTALVLIAAGCAKTVQPGANEANKRFLDAWMQVNYPGIAPTELGTYVLDQTKGEGSLVEKDGYAIVDYMTTDLDGNITAFTDKMTAKQLGQYDTSVYYGPKVWTTKDETIMIGLSDVLIGMKVGGWKKALIPSWLMTYKEDSSGSTSYDNTIYEFTVRDYTNDINGWEVGKIGEYLSANESLGLTVADSLQYGFYYSQLSAPSDTTSFPSDTTIYINYTGKLLNGLVFDTTDERTAKQNGIYSASKTYKPLPVKWAEEYSDIQLNSSGVISGFALTLWQMRAFEKGMGIFYSPLGYSYSGSGNSIPGYAPLIFEVEIVEKPED